MDSAIFQHSTLLEMTFSLVLSYLSLKIYHFKENVYIYWYLWFYSAIFTMSKDEQILKFIYMMHIRIDLYLFCFIGYETLF
jgi:hypothetical protein